MPKNPTAFRPEQFQAFLANPGPADFDADAGEHDFWASSRILDQYVVAGLWRLFGIRWQAVFLFAVAMSMLSCLFVFFIGHRVGGSYWAGLLAATLYFASPLASYLETWSLRDASPLWFATAGFCFLFCVVDRVQSPARRLAACVALGFVAMVGIGWRPDVLLLVLYLGFSLLVLSWLRGLSWRSLVSSLAVYGLSAVCCHAAIFALSSERELDSQNGFQNAVYADFSRANLLQIENSFQIQRCDRATLFLADSTSVRTIPTPLHSLTKVTVSAKSAARSFWKSCNTMLSESFRNFQKSIGWRLLHGLIVSGAFETQERRRAIATRSIAVVVASVSIDP